MTSIMMRSGVFFVLSELLLSGSNAFALTNLKQVQVSNGERVDLYFDGKVGRSQIKTEYFNDTIQFSLTDVSVYPAKISSVTGGDIAKIFAYQYAPKLVRCRITVRGKAENFRDKIKLDDRGKLLTISLGDPGEVQAEIPAAKPQPQPKEDAKIGASEKSLLERIMKDSRPSAPAKLIEAAKGASPQAAAPQPAAPQAAVEASAPPILGAQPLGVPSSPIAGGKPLASPMRAMGKFAIVLGLFGLIALALRKIIRGEGRIAASRHGSFGAIRRFAANRLGKPAKMIDIVSTHHLGPKKSIVVANIAGRMLVLGISNESINLITQLGPTPAAEPEGEDEAANSLLAAVAAPETDGPSFAGILEAESPKPAPVASNGPNVRNQIRSRLEGLKQL